MTLGSKLDMLASSVWAKNEVNDFFNIDGMMVSNDLL
jgi:hypothetical protein